MMLAMKITMMMMMVLVRPLISFRALLGLKAIK